ncbi:MAG: type II secretion system minor pseudopilin GspK [Candidatus Omnitrophica bacterium]|nr:type II secretion system minor pseudopilin GspK [Candidatus Omnitrophota bacterium]
MAHQIRSRGSLLIIALWLMVLLNLFALGLGFRASLELKLVEYQVRSLQARGLALAGVQQALAVIDADATPSVDGLADTWSVNPQAFDRVPVGQGTFTVAYALARPEAGGLVFYGLIDEERKLNLNALKANDWRLLERLPGMTQETAQAIADFVDTDPYALLPDGAEDEYYEGLEPAYKAKQAPLDALEELRLVKGMTPELYERLLPYVTIYTQGQAVNVNTAPPEVLQALGMPDTVVERILQVRDGEDRLPGTEDDGVFRDFNDIGAKVGMTANDILLYLVPAQPYLVFRSSTFTIEAEGRSANGKIVHRIHAVVGRQAHPRTHRRVIAWTEE